jgi:hypothetical protein
MQSKNKKTMTASERRHVDAIKALACSVCLASGPSDAHEIEQGKWFTSIPLCRDCHTGSHNGLHGQKAIWKVKKLTELGCLDATIESLYGHAK